MANRRRGADVLVKEAYPIECVRPPQAPVTGGLRLLRVGLFENAALRQVVNSI